MPGDPHPARASPESALPCGGPPGRGGSRLENGSPPMWRPGPLHDRQRLHALHPGGDVRAGKIRRDDAGVAARHALHERELGIERVVGRGHRTGEIAAGGRALPEGKLLAQLAAGARDRVSGLRSSGFVNSTAVTRRSSGSTTYWSASRISRRWTARSWRSAENRRGASGQRSSTYSTIAVDS